MNEEEIIYYYQNHTTSDTMKTFHIGYEKLNRIIDSHGIPRNTHKSSSNYTKETKTRLYGSPTYNNIEQAMVTKEERYGSKHYYNVEKCKETKLLNHGDPNYNNMEKMFKTKEERHGDRNYNNVEQSLITKEIKHGDAHYNNRDKAKETCLRDHGVEYTTQIPEVIEARKQTCLTDYNVPYACLLPQCKVKGNDSKPNRDFENILIKYGLKKDIDYTREYVIENRAYDFRLVKYNTLIEVNPTITHNITFSAFKTKPKDYTYHYDKCYLANCNGYKCICIWDWSDAEVIVRSILNNTLTIIKQPLKEYKCKIKNRDVIVVEDGQLLIVK